MKIQEPEKNIKVSGNKIEIEVDTKNLNSAKDTETKIDAELDVLMSNMSKPVSATDNPDFVENCHKCSQHIHGYDAACSVSYFRFRLDFFKFSSLAPPQ